MLREINIHQLKYISEYIYGSSFCSKKLLSATDNNLEDHGGFLSYKTSIAEDIQRGLKKQGVLSDFRGEYLRLGPAPYISDQQLYLTMNKLESVLRGL